MKDPRSPAFSSPELQKAVAEARPVLEGVGDARIRVSNDIKTLEAYLQGLDLKSSFRHSLGKRVVDPGGEAAEDAAASPEAGGSSSGEIAEEALVWGEDRSGRFRLLYELSRWQGYGPRSWEEATLTYEAKPLVETNFEIRKRIYKHLPDFVASLAKHFALRPRD